MSDLDPSGSSHEDVRRSSIEDLAGLLADGPVVAREGLPRNYRMRADSHYVDQLESRYDGRAIRLIATDEIDAADTPQAMSPRSASRLPRMEFFNRCSSAEAAPATG